MFLQIYFPLINPRPPSPPSAKAKAKIYNGIGWGALSNTSSGRIIRAMGGYRDISLRICTRDLMLLRGSPLRRCRPLGPGDRSRATVEENATFWSLHRRLRELMRSAHLIARYSACWSGAEWKSGVSWSGQRRLGSFLPLRFMPW
jgi:hypothetical protein